MKKSKAKKVMFISSTGGHFNEMSQLKDMLKKYDYYIVTKKQIQFKIIKNGST